MRLFLVWDDESEEHLDSTILTNTMKAYDESNERRSRKPKRSPSGSSASSEVDEAGFC